MDNIGVLAFQKDVSVRIINASKSYSGSTKVLNHLELCIPRGVIYGLLGPSGCGKTTLLRCLMGRTKLDEGEIYVGARKRKNIGYMPQEIALQGSLTIKETMEFYGHVFHVPGPRVKNFCSEMIKFLNLPDKNKVVSTLSGGQQRRLSFVISVLHNPELVILDEPTVGVDPILRQKLWDFLKILAEEGKTILITTHYIEEARQADKVALMRSGSILVENSPEQMLLDNHCTNIEELFLKLCYEQELQRGEPLSNKINQNTRKAEVISHLEPEPTWDLGRFRAQIHRNYIWAKRNKQFLAFLLSLPVALSLIINNMFLPHLSKVSLGIVSEELTVGFSQCKGELTNFCENFTEPAVCFYMEKIPKDRIILKEVSSLEYAKRLLEKGRIRAVLYFGRNFTHSLQERIDSGIYSSDNVIDNSTMTIWIDMTGTWMETEDVKSSIVESYMEFMKDILRSCNYTTDIASYPIKYNNAVFGNNEPVFLHGVLPGFLCTTAFFFSVTFTLSSIIYEIHSGLLERSLCAGVKFFEIAIANVVLQVIVLMMQNTIFLFVTYVLYTNPMQGDFLIAIFLLVLVECVGVAYGFLLAFIFDQERIATFTAIATLVALNNMNGTFWPFEGMHYILRRVQWAIPILPAIQGYNGVSQKGNNLSDPVVYYAVMQTSSWFFIICASSYIVFKARKIGNV